MTYGAEIWGPPVINAIGSIAGGYLGSQGKKETKIQEQKRRLLDDLIESVKTGKGEYADLFNADEDVFNKSYVEPAKARFRNQIAPGIQQSYIGAGQQGSSGMEDALLRAGVDLDQLLNEQYGNFQQNAMNRRSNALNGILGAPEGVAQNSTGQNLAQSAGGYLASDSFTKLIDSIFQSNKANGSNPQNSPQYPARKGYTPDRYEPDWSSEYSNRSSPYRIGGF